MSKIDDLNSFLQRSPFHQWLNCKITDFSNETGAVTILFLPRPELQRSPSTDAPHGGVLAAFVDIAAHAALHAQTGRAMPTIDLRVDYLRPGQFPITACATPQRVGKSIGTVDVQIKSADGQQCVLGRVVFLTRAP